MGVFFKRVLHAVLSPPGVPRQLCDSQCASVCNDSFLKYFVKMSYHMQIASLIFFFLRKNLFEVIFKRGSIQISSCVDLGVLLPVLSV